MVSSRKKSKTIHSEAREMINHVNHQCKQEAVEIFLLSYTQYSAFTDKPECNCHFLDPSRKCMTHHQALQGFLDTSPVPLHKNNKINLPISQQFLQVTAAFWFISERTVQSSI
jgi:hypothetical protein